MFLVILSSVPRIIVIQDGIIGNSITNENNKQKCPAQGDTFNLSLLVLGIEGNLLP